MAEELAPVVTLPQTPSLKYRSRSQPGPGPSISSILVLANPMTEGFLSLC